MQRRLLQQGWRHTPPARPDGGAAHLAQPLRDILGVLRSVEQLRPLLARLILTGQVGDAAVLRHLVDFLVRFSDRPSSLHLSRLLSAHYFRLVPSSAAFLFNILIRGCARSKRPAEAIAAFAQMLRSGSLPDNFTFPFLAVAAAKVSRREGELAHCQALRRGHDADVYVVNTLLNMYSEYGDMGSAQKLFDTSSRVLDVVSWNTIIDGYVKAGFLMSARHLFDRMPARDEVSWSAMIGGYTGSGELDVAQSLFDRMPASVGRNAVTWNSMITGFAKQGLLPLARKFFDDMPERNIVSWNAMISGYALNGKMSAARALFDEMPERDVVSWSSMISGYVQSSHYREALELFNQMQLDRNVRPNEVTMVSLLSSCAHLAALEQGKWIHAYIDRNRMRLDSDDNLGASLVDMYAKCGCVDSAIKVFRNMNHRNVSTWNAMISGLAINGLAYESVDMFEEMQRSGTKPNDITFLGVLMACTHGGLVDLGRQYFGMMSDTHGIEPQMKHYGCLVDLLGRAGMLEEAEEAIRSMPMKPDVMILGALLGACRIHRNVQVAERLTVDFLELNSQEAGCHVLISNIYAAAGRWGDASEIRRLLRRRGIKKIPGSSSLELDGTIYEFVSGDQSHQKTSEIYDLLDQKVWKLRSGGDSPATEEVFLDSNEEE